ncbi:hypothetical protein [Mycoplasma sp. HS2188]|uniref:hypothetical protein n=1 Tax=Mycoplasma sp. HS2188 TaxID=2976765 RepID=UPI0021AA3588|nr:hypothetical protein [Mycoplasma sp. HS2188]MCT4469697.1 hypothetical protein [Mycoplasma sp. HS2188]
MKDSIIKKPKSKTWIDEIFKVNVYELVLGAIFLSMHIVIIYFAKFTILRVIPVQLEYLMFIFYGLIFGPFKGAILSLLGDTLVLLLTGSIGTWFWLYAIVPPLISVVSYFYFLMFKKTKIIRFVFAYTLTIISFVLAIIIYLKYADPNGDFKLSKKVIAPRNIIVILIMVYAFLSLILTTFFTILYFIYKNEKWNYYILVTSLILFISIVFRWILGPVSYIEFYNYFFAPKSGKLKHYGIDYIVLFVKIVIKDLFIIPIYITVFSPVFIVTNILKEKFINNVRKIKY